MSDLSHPGDRAPSEPFRAIGREHLLHQLILRHKLPGYEQSWFRAMNNCRKMVRSMTFSPEQDELRRDTQTHGDTMLHHINALGKALLREYQLQERAAPEAALTEATDQVLQEWRRVHDEIVYFQNQFPARRWPSWEEFEPALAELRHNVAQLPAEKDLAESHAAALLRTERQHWLLNHPRDRDESYVQKEEEPESQPAALTRQDMYDIATKAILRSPTPKGITWCDVLPKVAEEHFSTLESEAKAQDEKITPAMVTYEADYDALMKALDHYAARVADHYAGGNKALVAANAFTDVLTHYRTVLEHFPAESRAKLPSDGDLGDMQPVLKTLIEAELLQAGVPRATGRGVG